MKMILVVFASAAMATVTFAADITLKDGRVLKGATVVSQTPRKVTIKHDAGLGSVAKELLPPELRAQYPLDEAAARRADEKAIVAREAALVARKAETERLARLRTEREAAADAYAAKQAAETAKKRAQNAASRSDARALAERYFEKDYGWSGTGSRTASVTIDEIRPADGIDGCWFVTGRAVIRVYNPTTHYSTYRQGGNTADEWRDQYNKNQIAYQNRQASTQRDSVRSCPAPSPEHPGRDNSPHGTKQQSGEDHSRRNRYPDPQPTLFPNYSYNQTDNDSDYSVETREFEGYYSTEASTPSLSVTLR